MNLSNKCSLQLRVLPGSIMPRSSTHRIARQAELGASAPAARSAEGLGASDAVLAVIKEIELLLPEATSTHWTLKGARNEALKQLETALEQKAKEVHAQRYELLSDDFGNSQGRIVFRGDGRGPEAFGLDSPESLEDDEEVFSPRDPEGEQSIMREVATQNMVSTSEEHNLPSRYFGYAKQNYDKSSEHKFNFTIYAIFLPEETAVRVSDYLEHRKGRHEDSTARGEMSGQDNIGSKELASKVAAVTKGNTLGYRVIGRSSNKAKDPGPYISVNEPDTPVPVADADQFNAFKSSNDLSHTGAM